jgi:hypothetical protein
VAEGLAARRTRLVAEGHQMEAGPTTKGHQRDVRGHARGRPRGHAWREAEGGVGGPQGVGWWRAVEGCQREAGAVTEGCRREAEGARRREIEGHQREIESFNH